MTKITTVSAATVAAAGAIGIVSAPLAFADATTQTVESQANTQTLGSQAKLVDGAVVQGWTITNLQPSTDAIPHQVAGTLWEATATDQAIEGSATPIVSNLNARAESGQTYRALFGVATPQGVNPSTIAQGQETSGKVYFDVTGDKPDSVVYNAGGQDLLVWVQPPPSSTRSATPSYSYPSGSQVTAAPAATPATPAAPAPAAPGAMPAAAGAEVPAGSQGTPLPAGSQETPLPAGSQGTPLPPAEGAPVPPAEGAPVPPAEGAPVPPAEGAPVPPAEGAPVPAGTEVAPQPAGNHGTPLPADGEQVPTPTTYTPAPTA